MASSQPFDIAIYGSTSAAVASAVQAARLGHSVALVSPQDHIGGIQIEGLGGSDIDNQPEFQNSRTLGGLNLEFHRRVSKLYGRQSRLDEVLSKGVKDPEVWRFESRVAEKVILEWLAEFPSIVIIKSPLAEKNGVRREGNHVKEIALENGRVISAKIFIEASYEGDFLAAAGISTVFGRESRDTYNESLAGIRESTIYRQITVPVDPYVEPGNTSSGLLFGISPEPFGVPGGGDLHLQAFSYRMPLTDAPNNRVPFTMPEGYDPAHYELHRRFFNSGGVFFLPQKKVPNNKTDIIGSEAPLAMDLLGMNDEWPTASYSRRREILDETARFTKGLLWFITTDQAVPDHYRQEWARYGYCRDEFTDNGHFPRQLYVRDARRMVSDYIITEATASRDGGEPQVSDPVAVAFWPTDTHSVRRILRDGKVHNEGFIFKGAHRWRPFGIAYRSLVPKRDEAVNVITATCPSSSHVGYGAVRLEHQFYALGQVCGNACDLALADGVGVQDVPYDKLRVRLENQGVVLNVESVGVPSFDV